VQTASSVFHGAGRDLTIVTARPPCQQTERTKILLRWKPWVRLVSGVAHDFNNLLTGILLYCDRLDGGVGGSSAAAKSQVKEMRGAGRAGWGADQQFPYIGAPSGGGAASQFCGMTPLLGSSLSSAADWENIELRPA